MIFLIANLCYAQNQQAKKEIESATKPLELPNFIIQGTEQLNVKSGIKQYPKKPSVLSAQDLDSLNSLDKKQSLLLRPSSLPKSIISSSYKKGYVIADFGRYSNANFESGYGYHYKEYRFFANAGFNHSNGHITNAEYNKINLNLFNDYIAPEKFFIFGGSKTRTALTLQNNTYKLFSEIKAPQRSLTNLDMSIISDGKFKNYVFSTGAGFKTLQANQKDTSSSANAVNNLLNGFLEIKNANSDYEIGGKASVDVGSLRAKSIHFFQASLFGKYNFDKYSINLNAGFQTGAGSKSQERVGILINANLDYKFSELFTFKAGAYSGLKMFDYISEYNYNPYMSFTSNIDFTYDIIMLNGFVYYHPLNKINLSAGIKFGTSDRVPVFDTLTNGVFNLNYQTVHKVEAIVEGSYQLSKDDSFIFNGTVNYSILASNSKQLPNNAPYKFSFDYRKKWFDSNFGTNFGLVYFGSRYADFDNMIVLKSYLDLRFYADYQINNVLTVYMNLQNILNENIFIWQGYKERGLFFNLGVNYLF